MVAMGVAALWAGYTLTMYGYCLVRGYDVQFAQLFHTTWPGLHVRMQAPTHGHKLGTITSSGPGTTNPGQVLG